MHSGNDLDIAAAQQYTTGRHKKSNEGLPE
jgi:hypothetical protein